MLIIVVIDSRSRFRQNVFIFHLQGANMDKTNLIFVYGSLRQTHVNHQLLNGARCYGIGSTIDNYAMYLSGGYPYVICTEDRYPIVGELYAVDGITLKQLDKMEGHPHYFVRKKVGVVVDDKEYSAWMYVREHQGRLLSCGDFNQLSDS